ncbi:MAG: response regulator, partial [Ensifer adhaerens]
VLERAGQAVRLVTDFGAVDQILSGAGEQVQPMPELIVTDLNMPAGDGFSMLKRLRENEARGAERRLPVVVLTSDARLEIRDRLVAAGADVVLPKPADPQRLMAEISRLLEIR